MSDIKKSFLILMAAYISSQNVNINCSYSLSRHPEQSTSEMDCIIYNTSSLNCTLPVNQNVTEKQPFFFFFRQNNHMKECPIYLIDYDHGTFLCHFPKLNISSLKFYIHVNGSINETVVFRPLKIEKLNPPVNISVSVDNENISITWGPPPTRVEAPEDCLEYHLRFVDLHRNEKVIEHVSSSYHIPKSHITKPCLVQLRVQGKEICGFGKILSDWTKPFSIDATNSSRFKLPLLALNAVIFVFGAICVCSSQYRRIPGFHGK
ncbi:interleukin-5 receptor subunit alpha-like isoform X2 [Polypterus senegalus]|uniref:interleukin-5 receptor subunit alpha-like isoform X2 n=1 Tax=Polypterus senegalus TaxID=55291 RepID=UPI001962C486|nr:interleukin-5 receptor subunit alpha-like isoform X2 [Polypterus senegalus]